MRTRRDVALASIVVLLLLLLLAPLAIRGQESAAPTDRGPAARLTGTVRDSAGRPVPGASVSVRGIDIEATAGPDGAFTLGAVPAGAHTLEVRAIGYAFRQLPITVVAGRSITVTVRLDRVPTLAPVTVRGDSSPWLAEFLDRRLHSRTGRFVTAEDIAWLDPLEVADVLKRFPEVEVRAGRLGKKVFARGISGPCVASIIVDGQAVPIGDELDGWVGPSQVAAIEFYPDVVSIPVKYRHVPPPRFDGCGALLVWTRH